jgi:hypothetical protein
MRSTIHEETSVGPNDDLQKRPVGYVSIVSLSSTIPVESTDNTTSTRPKFGLSTKRHHHHPTADFGESLSNISLIKNFLFSSLR